MLVTTNENEKILDEGIVEPTFDQIIDEDTTESSEPVEETTPTEEDSTEHVEAEVVDGEPNFQPNMFNGMRGMGALGNLLGRSSPDYSELFKTFSQAFEQQDTNTEILKEAINNLVSQLNKYKRNQSWKMRIAYILILITWIIMFIKF